MNANNVNIEEFKALEFELLQNFLANYGQPLEVKKRVSTKDPIYLTDTFMENTYIEEIEVRNVWFINDEFEYFEGVEARNVFYAFISGDTLLKGSWVGEHEVDFVELKNPISSVMKYTLVRRV